MVTPAAISPVTFVLALAAIVVGISTVPFVMSAIDYRHRDNGLAYLVLVLGVGIWNGMFAAQLLTGDAVIEGFFFALSVVGSVQAGLGFLLFATTASSTPDYLSRRDLYAVVGVLGGLDIVLAATAPAHSLYWSVLPRASDAIGAAAVAPQLGYWLHTMLLVAFIGAAVVLFADARRLDPENEFLKMYVTVGTITILGIVASNVVLPGGLAVGAVLSGGLTALGWMQATSGRPLALIRNRGRSLRSSMQWSS